MSNLHVNLDEANKHTPKGFDLVGNNTFPTKDENGFSTYEERMSLPKAINFVDGTLAAPSTADGDVFVLTGSGVVHPDWGSATFDDWVRFTNSTAVKISPLSGYLCFDVTANEWKEYNGADWVVHDDTGATNLSEGATTTTTVDVDSSTGTNATLNEATTLRAGVMSSAKFDEVEANTLKVTNATHTGEVSGSGALTAQPTIISNKTTLGSLSGTEEFLINDGGVLKKVLASNVGGGDSIYTADGTVPAATIATLTTTITFSGGTTILKGVNTLGSSSALLVQNSASTDLLKVANDGSTTIGGDTGIGIAPISGTPLRVSRVGAGDIAVFQVSGFPFVGIGQTGMYINSSGMLGGDPTTKLSVSGKIYCNNDMQASKIYVGADIAGVSANFEGGTTASLRINGNFHQDSGPSGYGYWKNLSVGTGAAPASTTFLEVASSLTTKSSMNIKPSLVTNAPTSPNNGDLVYMSNTDATFTSVGFWGYENGAWVKL